MDFFEIIRQEIILKLKESSKLDEKYKIIMGNDEKKEESDKPKKYNQKKYYNTFVIKNKDKIIEKQQCDICCGSYTYYNKSKHYKSNRHLKMANKLNLII